MHIHSKVFSTCLITCTHYLLFILLLPAFCGTAKAQQTLQFKILLEKDSVLIKYVGAVSNGMAKGKGIAWDAQNDFIKLYEGDWVNNLFDGAGTLWNRNHFKLYEGNFKNGKKNGMGSQYYPDATYVGNWVNDKRSGKGKIIWNDGGSYDGDWADDKRNGKGKIVWKDSSNYYGDWVEDFRTGKGKYIWKDGMVYEGDWVKGNREGKGKIIWPDGSFYDGDWAEDARTGKAKYIWKDGAVYEGGWIKGNREGKGKMTWADGSSYDGDWMGNYINGYGKSIKNGEVYEGSFTDGKKNGQGKITYANGDIFEGVFTNDVITGMGTKTLKGGETKTGYYENGNLLEEYAGLDSAVAYTKSNNNTAALESYKRAAAKGSKYAMYQAGRMQEDNSYGLKNENEAIIWLKKALDAGYGNAQAELENYHKKFHWNFNLAKDSKVNISKSDWARVTEWEMGAGNMYAIFAKSYIHKKYNLIPFGAAITFRVTDAVGNIIASKRTTSNDYSFYFMAPKSATFYIDAFFDMKDCIGCSGDSNPQYFTLYYDFGNCVDQF